MTRGKRIFILALLGLVMGFAQTFAGQSAERAQDQAAQSSNDFRVGRVWTGKELVQQISTTDRMGVPRKDTIRPLPGSIFVLVEFVSLVKEATTSPVLVDSEGARYMPVGVSPFSTEEFQFLVPMVTGLSKVLTNIKTQQFPGGMVEVTKDTTTGQLTIEKIAEPGSKFTAAWTVPQDVLMRCSEFKLHIGEGEPFVIDARELRKK